MLTLTVFLEHWEGHADVVLESTSSALTEGFGTPPRQSHTLLGSVGPMNVRHMSVVGLSTWLKCHKGDSSQRENAPLGRFNQDGADHRHAGKFQNRCMTRSARSWQSAVSADYPLCDASHTRLAQSPHNEHRNPLKVESRFVHANYS